MTPEPNRARTSEAPNSDLGSHFPLGPTPLSFPGAWFFFEADGRGGSSGVDDYPVKANVMIWTGPVTGGVICNPSAQRQTTGIGLTITHFNYPHVLDVCVKVYPSQAQVSSSCIVKSIHRGPLPHFNTNHSVAVFKKDANKVRTSLRCTISE